MKSLRKIIALFTAILILICFPLAALASSSADSYNDVSFPLTEYPAVPEVGGYMPSEILSWFLNEDGSETWYAGSHQCDGFAKYAHDRFWHVENWNRNYPSWEVNGAYTADVNTTKLEWRNKNYEDAIADNTYVDRTYIVRDFFSSLGRGSFVRYGKADDPSPANGVHSIVFDRLSDDGTGIWVYEANQDGECGIGYQMYTFSQIHNNYEYILYYVEHTLSSTKTNDSVTHHKVACLNCDGYLRQTHTGTKTYTKYSATQHGVRSSCCAGIIYSAHIYS